MTARNPACGLSFDAPAIPALESLAAWSVGAAASGNTEVRLELTSNSEAKAWIQYMLAREPLQ